MYVIKKDDKYFKSCFRNPNNKKIIDICWIDDIQEAKKFNNKEGIDVVFENNVKPEGMLIKKVMIVESNED